MVMDEVMHTIGIGLCLHEINAVSYRLCSQIQHSTPIHGILIYDTHTH